MKTKENLKSLENLNKRITILENKIKRVILEKRAPSEPIYMGIKSKSTENISVFPAETSVDIHRSLEI